MLAAVSDSDNLDVHLGHLSRFLSWHRLHGTEGFSLPLEALWIGENHGPPNLPPVRESVGISGSWTVYRFEDASCRRSDLKAALMGQGSELTSLPGANYGDLGRFVPVLPHDLPPSDVLQVLSDVIDGHPKSRYGYLLQHRETGRLLSSTEHVYPVRPLL